MAEDGARTACSGGASGPAVAGAGIGDAPPRREDLRFLTGRGTYLDDLVFDDLAYAVIVRSPHAHARIVAIDVAAACATSGVLAVLTHTDAQNDALGPMLPVAQANTRTGEPFLFAPQPLLARERVRYAGEAIALIVAASPTQALDAAECVTVDYQPLPCVTTAAAARAAGAALVSPEVPGNLCMDWQVGDAPGVDAACAAAAHLVTLAIHNHRVVTNPMEPRGAIGSYDPVQDRYTLYVSSQNIHGNRDLAARCLRVPSERVRFIAPDVGGGFGAKNFAYPEHALILWAAKRTGRRVKWIASRNEVFLSDHQARDHHAEAHLALDASGHFLALRIHSLANVGAYLAGGTGGVQTNQYAHLPGTIYAIPAIDLRITTVLTNTTPVGVMRGPGFAEMVNIMERLIDHAARQCGFDRTELRRKNMLRSAPMTNAFGSRVDSGEFARAFELGLERADVAGFPSRRRASEATGKLRGLGFAYHIKATGGLPRENVTIRFEEDGTIALVTGTQAIGQGHETTLPQILAHRLGVADGLIHLHQGDTDIIPMGGGHGSSRSTYMAGTAIWRAADEIITKGRRIAADMLEAAEADLQFAGGHFIVAGTNLTVPLVATAVQARERGTPLDTYHAWTREHMTYPNGLHVVEVEIDRETGRVILERVTAVDDYGVLVNPMIAAGQAHGAMAQGAGQALLERMIYDADSGQPVTASFMDYALPRADDLPRISLGFHATRCATNPLGVKGCGEAGAIAMFPAIGNAVADALAQLGVTAFDGPATPYRVWQAIRGR
jgi:aerobic carbon-monoxide dehydrogenase large subunit